MKVIGVSNFDNESEADLLVCDNVNEHFGNIIVNHLNEITNEFDTYYYKVVENDHKLWRGMEELV